MSGARCLVLILIAAALAGCFSEIPTKAGATDADLKRDYGECHALAVENAPRRLNAQTGQMEPDAYTVTRDRRRCLQARGWHFAPAW